MKVLLISMMLVLVSCAGDKSMNKKKQPIWDEDGECLRHAWSKWSYSSIKASSGNGVVYERTCNNCGIIQYTLVNEFTDL